MLDNPKTPLYIRPTLTLTQPNLITIHSYVLDAYDCGGLSGQLEAVFFKFRAFRTFLIRTFLMAPHSSPKVPIRALLTIVVRPGSMGTIEICKKGEM